MARILSNTGIVSGQTVEAQQVSQSIDAFSAANQQDYDISISGSFKVTGSQFIEPDTLLTQIKPFILSYDETTGQIFKMSTASIDDGDDGNEVYKTGSSASNIIPSNFGTYENTGTNSTIASGDLNKITSACSFIGGGIRNTASANLSFIGGGDRNIACASWSFVGSGFRNTASGAISAIAGGNDNVAAGQNSFIGGGCRNIASGVNSSIVGGTLNTASSARDIIAGGCKNTISSAYGQNQIGGGTNNTITGPTAGNMHILAGINNTVSGCYNSFNGIVAGSNNTISSEYATGQNQIIGGNNNTISGYGSDHSTITSGNSNQIITSAYSSIIGGTTSTINSKNCAFIVGSDIIASSVCTTFVNNLTVSGSAGGTSVVMMRGLPTSDPSNVDQLWNDGGTLKVSAG